MVVSIRPNSSRSSPIILLVDDSRRRFAVLPFLEAADRPLALLPSIIATLSGKVGSGCSEQMSSMGGVNERRYREELEVRVELLALLL
jgi:hypothetical protein